MAEALHQRLGRHGVSAVLGVPWRTLLGWRDGKVPSAVAMRTIWLIWCLVLHPERLRSLFDIATWGQFQEERREARPVDHQIVVDRI
jgi:hypothetical protein